MSGAWPLCGIRCLRRIAFKSGLLLLAAQWAQAAPGVPDYAYHARLGDTLIGIGRRLLLDPKRWRDVQLHNQIPDPRRIPPGSILRIPYDWLRVSVETATVSSVAGQVELAGKPVVSGEVLTQGSVVETGSDGSVTINLADGSVLTLQKSSSLTLDEMTRIPDVEAARSIRLKLGSGRVETIVKPHGDVGRFEIITPVAVSAVRGTQFRDSYSAQDSHATAETLEGKVGVSGDTGSVAVSAGFGTRVERDQAPLPPVPLLPPPDLAGIQEAQSFEALHLTLSPVAGARQYRVQLASEPRFRALIVDLLTADGTGDIPGLADGDYWVRARSIDGLGIEGSDAVKHLRHHVLLEAPQPMNPSAESKISSSRTHFTWAAVKSASHYTLQVAKDPGFAIIAVERGRLEAPSADLDALPAGRYYWRIAALNSAGETGQWSMPRPFTQRPSIPMPEAPLLESKRLMFSWAAFADHYRVQIARDAAFNEVVSDKRVSNPQWSRGKMFPGVYYFRVEGMEADGSSIGFSPTRRFVVRIPLWMEITAPLAIALGLLL